MDFGLDGTSASVFAAEKMLVFEFLLHPHDLEHMQEHAREEVWVPAHLDVGTAHIGLVGLRFKGRHGSLYQPLDDREDGQAMPKLSMKVGFDKHVEGQRFNGLRRLNFHSMILDRSLMKERLAYQAFREAGFPAPRCSHAMIVINGEYKGVYAMVEQVDQVFVEERFPQASGGVLYKERWPASQRLEHYEKYAKTNSKSPDHAVMLGFATALHAAEFKDLPTVASRHANLDRLVRYFILDQALRNWDGVRKWTANSADETFTNHNFYVYLSPEHELSVIPWDLDVSLRPYAPLDKAPIWYDLEASPSLTVPVGTVVARAPTIDPLTRAVAMHARGRYREYARELLDGPLALDHLFDSIDAWAEQIRAAVAHDPFFVWNWEWEWYWARQRDELRADLELIRAWMESEIRNWDDTIPASHR